MTEQDKRHEVLTAWGKQDFPLVVAPTYQLGQWWMVRNDEYLSAQQGSYKRFIVTPSSSDRLRGLHLDWAVLIEAPRLRWTEAWSRLLQDLEYVRCSTWTEVLP